MRLLINIPKEFEQNFQEDRFEDSLHRLSSDAHLLAGNYEQETAVMLIEAFAKAVHVPPHGRLIDADALSQMFDPDESFGAAVLEIIADTPTIIPAEEGE